LREEKNSLTPHQRQTLFLANVMFGNLLFTSDDIATYSRIPGGAMDTYRSQFPISERRIRRVYFQDEFYSWRERSTLAQFVFGASPFATVAVVELDIRAPNGAWVNHVAVFNLGAACVKTKLPLSSCFNQDSIKLEAYQSCLLRGDAAGRSS
jgi:hypothetical protein